MAIRIDILPYELGPFYSYIFPRGSKKMHIDKYKDKDGKGYTDKDDCWHEDAEAFIQCGILGHCGCGAGGSSLKYIKNVLRLIYEIQLNFEKTNSAGDKSKWNKLHSFFHSEGEEYTIYYMLDKLDLIEHGCSVPGWLTEKGIELLEDLEELYSAPTCKCNEHHT